MNSCPNDKAYIFIAPAKRVMSLSDPRQKMSKSHPYPYSRILLTDSRDEINAKIRRALTDSIPGITYDPVNRPAVSNLLEILSNLQAGEGSYQDLAASLSGMSIQSFKEHLIEEVDYYLSGIRERYSSIIQDVIYLRSIAKTGAEKAEEGTKKQLTLIKGLIGF